MNVLCGGSEDPCPIRLNSDCVFYEGATLTLLGINTNDSVQTVIEKINEYLESNGGGGSLTVLWGDITGTVTNQTDLISYLNSNYYPLLSNPAGYLTAETDPIFTAWLAGPPDISEFNNDVGYITSAALSGYVPTSRQLTINGVAQDLSANRSWSVGTVTSFSSGNLSPLFTTSVSTATSTPALSFALVNQNANLVYAGPGTGAAAAPTFRALVTNDLANDLVTYAKIQNVSATSRILGRITGGAGDIEELTGTQATTLLDVFTDVLKGLVPASGGGTSNFLRADGTWAPAAGGGITNGAGVNEMMKSDGTNAVASGIFSTSSADLRLGSTSIAGATRTISVQSSVADCDLVLIPYGSGQNKISGKTVIGAGVTSITGVANLTVSWVSSTNDINYPFRLRNTRTSGFAAGLGTGMEFETETAASNYEIGSTIGSVSTSLTAASENFDFIINNMRSGTLREVLRINSQGNLTVGNNNIAGGKTIEILSSDAAATLTLRTKGSNLIFDPVSGASAVMDFGNTSNAFSGAIVRVLSSSANVSFGINAKGTGSVYFTWDGGGQSPIEFTNTTSISQLVAGSVIGTSTNFRITSRNGASSGQGGRDLILKAGDGTLGNANGGHIFLDNGAKAGTGVEGNFAIGTSSVANWQSMENGLFIHNLVTEPSAAIADGIVIYSVDDSAETILGLRVEKAVAVDASVPSTHSLRVKINGTIYKLLLATP